VSHDPRYAEAVEALRCFRGIDTITATSIVAELHDVMRFESPRGLMARELSGFVWAALRKDLA
jgi:transposase